MQIQLSSAPSKIGDTCQRDCKPPLLCRDGRCECYGGSIINNECVVRGLNPSRLNFRNNKIETPNFKPALSVSSCTVSNVPEWQGMAKRALKIVIVPTRSTLVLLGRVSALLVRQGTSLKEFAMQVSSAFISNISCFSLQSAPTACTLVRPADVCSSTTSICSNRLQTQTAVL